MSAGNNQRGLTASLYLNKQLLSAGVIFVIKFSLLDSSLD